MVDKQMNIRRRVSPLKEDKRFREARLARRRSRDAADQLDWYPMTAPGMPLPGPDFITQAANAGDTSEITGKGSDATLTQVGDKLERYHKMALRRPNFRLQISLGKGKSEVCPFVPGHLWDEAAPVDGPVPSEVMVIGKMPGFEEVACGRNLIGKSGELLREKAAEFNARDPEKWYVTNLCKFKPPETESTLKATWIKDCMPLLHQELRLVRPKYILCLGADASKALLGDKFNVTYMMGRVEELTFPFHLDGYEPLYHTALVMTVKHPAAILRYPDQEPELDQGMARWAMLLDGIRFDQEERGIEHYVVRTPEELDAILEIAERDIQHNMVAVDAEWHGDHPCNEGSYLRTFQFSWGPKKAACVVIRQQGGGIVREGWEDFVRGKLNRFFDGKRVCGHFLNADLEWLVPWGLDLRSNFRVPAKTDDDGRRPWSRLREEGGADTGIMFHAIEETADYGLEMISLRYTTAPRYDKALNDWKIQECKNRGIKTKALEGYGECPDEILCPYGNYDADVTYRAWLRACDLLDNGYYDESAWEAFWRNKRATPAVLEIHQTGIKLDRERVDELTANFMAGRSRLEEGIRRWANWPGFNVRSVQHVSEYLYGEQYNGRVWIGDKPDRIRPAGARSLYLEPLLDTSKRPIRWAEIRARGEEREHNPSTNKLVLSILAQDNPKASKQVNWIRNLRFVDQVLKSVLKPPDVDESSGSFVEDEDGELQYSGGLASAVCDDGRIRTHIYQTKETGRWSSARPPLQNLSKRRDKDYANILGKDRYKKKLRSLLMATPKGDPGAWCDEDTVLVEADFTGAELCGMAWMSGDSQMIEHARRNVLPDDHPDYYDIHSNVAVFAFRLTCPPTKKGLEDAGLVHLRIVAKSVIFGIAYGRGAKAIALAAREENIRITEEDAQAIIDAIFHMYPLLKPFFEECARRSANPGWLCSCYRRFRRFPYTTERSVMQEFERQAMNFPIQSMIADAMNTAIANLYDYRDEVGDPDMYRIVLQVHDAVLLEVPLSRVGRVVNEVLPTCMVKRVPIYPTDLEGVRTSSKPYRLGIEIEVGRHWGEKITKEECSRLHIHERYGAAA